MKKLGVFVLAVLVIVSCGGRTQYLDATKDEGSREWGPREIKTTVSKMVSSLYSFLKDEYKKPAYLQVRKFRNLTSEHIDTQMIANEIATNLIKKRIKFIDETMTKDTIEEIEKGMTGMYDAETAIPVGMLKQPNLWLTGDIRDNVRRVGNRQIQYLVVTLKLVEAATRVEVWNEQQEFLKSSSATRVSF
ncbi:MAG: penicillin-binding protein activator LpoB [Spirochaetes bacterium]|nr:penicillin-binding protein activator LpoB [Spirochaetota bacterium]